MLQNIIRNNRMNLFAFGSCIRPACGLIREKSFLAYEHLSSSHFLRIYPVSSPSKWTCARLHMNRSISDMNKCEQTDSTTLSTKSPSFSSLQIDSQDGNTNNDQLRWKDPPSFSLSYYKDLTKAKLAALVVLTTMAGYAVAPGAASVSSLLWTTIGTGLCVSSANAINQWIETPYDAQMSRTRNRVLVRQAMSPTHSFLAGTLSGVTGSLILWHLVNPTAAILGSANIILYTCAYTPLKRISIANTWVGSIVGAIPPMIGWVGCTGTLDPGAWILASVLFAWQFPHFNSLSWNLRADYSKAGYRMMSVTNPKLNARVSLRYSLLLFPICWAAVLLNVTTPWFLIGSSLVNGYMSFCAFQFYRSSNDKFARSLFFSSLIHLPLIMALFILHKSNGEPVDDDHSSILSRIESVNWIELIHRVLAYFEKWLQ